VKQQSSVLPWCYSPTNVFTRARHWSLSCPIHLTYCFKTHFNIILPSILKSPKWSLHFRFSDWNVCISPTRATCPAYLILLDFITLIMFRERVQIMKHLNVQFSLERFLSWPLRYLLKYMQNAFRQLSKYNDSAVSWATGFRYPSPSHPDRLCDPPSLLANVYGS
jgi:hypothetical protein